MKLTSTYRHASMAILSLLTAWNGDVVGFMICPNSGQSSRLCTDLRSNERLSFVQMRQSTASNEAGLDDAEYVRQQLAKKKAEYEAERRKREAQIRSRETGANADIPPLSSLPFIPYIDETTGLITKPDGAKSAKATVCAVYDENQTIQFIGVTRNIVQTLRMQLARCPDLTYYYKVYHINKPSRTLLELVKEKWFEEVGSPRCNDDGELQKQWESAMDVKPLMTEQDKEDVAKAKDVSKIKEEMAMKKIARRYEDAKVEILEQRGVKEEMRFDPKLKAEGLLDFYTERTKDVVPSSKPKPKKK